MLQYLARRLLLLPPTFFMISLVVFLVLNVAPGRPGEAGQDAGESENSSLQEESYRIFREQFNLDKPILLNTRFLLSRDRTRELLVAANNVGGEASLAERVRAKERLDDLGNDLVRHLVQILAVDDDPEVQRLAAGQLTKAAQLRLRLGRAAETDEGRATNRKTSRINEEIKAWRWDAEASPAEVAEVKQTWASWWSANADTYTYTAGESAWALLFETRFAKYWANLITLDFGVSNVDRRPVIGTLISKIKYSVSLAVFSILLAYLLAVPMGIYSAVRQGTAVDNTMTVVLFVLYSIPTFFSGTVYLRLFTEGDPFGWFPTGGFSSLDSDLLTTLELLGDIGWHLVLPVLTFTAGALAALSRYARTGIIDVIRADYVRTARAKGLSEPVVILKHAARNGMIPILTLLASILPLLVGGSVVIEVVFNIPGMGLFLFDAINLRDYNAVMAVLLASSFLSLIGILVSDLLYAVVDPRITFD